MPIQLDADRIIDTSRLLQRRVAERFPESGLSRVAEELHVVARDAADVAHWLSRPIRSLRILVVACVLLLIAGLAITIGEIRLDVQLSNLKELVPFLESLVNDIVFIGVGIFFLVTVEGRIKRTRAQKALHVLRSLAHIVDMHQLTKDPERLLHPGPDTESSPKREMTAFELTRYLDYCSEILSIISKIGAVYVQHFEDPLTVSAASDVEALTVGLTRKIWQKIMLLDRVVPGGNAASGV